MGVTKYERGVGKISLSEWPEPDTGPGEVKMAVKAAGICGTDIHIEDDEHRYTPPVVLGHECAGEVVEVGSEVPGIAIGDRVTAIQFVYTCGQCPNCLRGLYNQCAKRRAFGIDVNGGFAPFLVVPAKVVRLLPETLAYEGGALIEPLACCVKAVVETASIRAGDVALVSGPGPIGLMAMQVAKAQGATTVLVGLGRDAHRLQLGRELGADLALSVEGDDVRSAVEGLTDGEGADVVLECSGAPAAICSGLSLLRKRGQFVQMGLHGKPFALDYDQITYKDARVLGSIGYSMSSWDRGLRLADTGRIQLTPLVSTVLPLSGWEKGFGMVRAREGIKVVLQPNV